MNFESSQTLVFLLFLPVFWLAFFRRSRSAGEKRRSIWLFLAAAFLIFSLAKPYWKMVHTQRVVKGADLIVMLDVSQSMFCRNSTETRRIDQARLFLRRLLPEFSGSPVSVLYFAGDTHIGSPFTTDLPAIYMFLDSITPGMTTIPGTNSGSIGKVLEGLLADRARSSTSGSTRPLVLLFSDGEFFDSTGSLQSTLRRHPDLRLFSFLCGTGGSAVPRFDLSGPAPDAFSTVHPEKLQSIASSTNGRSYELSKTSIDVVAGEVSRHVNTLIAEGELIPENRSNLFIALASLCMLIYRFLPFIGAHSVRPIRRRIPALPSLAVALLLLTTVSMTGSPSQLFSSALNDAKNKKYDQALKKLKDLQTEYPAEEISVAIGNIYFEQGKFQEAVEQYREALRKNSRNTAARWNWEVVLKKQSSSSPPPPQPQPKNAPAPEPQKIPSRIESLLQYFDQLEQQQMELENRQNANQAEFAW